MELTRTWIDDAGTNRVRVCGEVTYDDRPGHPETYWFDFPRECASEITTTGNPWAVALLPLAATLGEPLRLRIPIDSVLLANLTRLLGVWHSWYRGLSVVPIITDVDVGAAQGRKGQTPIAPVQSAAAGHMNVLEGGKAQLRVELCRSAECHAAGFVARTIGGNLELQVGKTGAADLQGEGAIRRPSDPVP